MLKGHQLVQEKIKEIRQNFSEAVTAGTRSGSGKIVLELYNKLCSIWGGSPATEPLPYGVETDSFETFQDNDSEEVDSSVVEGEQEQDLDDVDGPVNEDSSVTRKRPSANQVPVLIDTKRKHLERNLSAAQRDKLLINEAKEEKQ